LDDIPYVLIGLKMQPQYHSKQLVWEWSTKSQFEVFNATIKFGFHGFSFIRCLLSISHFKGVYAFVLYKSIHCKSSHWCCLGGCGLHEFRLHEFRSFDLLAFVFFGHHYKFYLQFSKAKVVCHGHHQHKT